MNKIPIILGILVIILFIICMNTKEFLHPHLIYSPELINQNKNLNINN